uniref:Uncharacterized protein n=1 Tax=Ditylenchus dipsaci TaxID=166011 RepID=A0A915CVB6_9BILA
MMAQMGQMAQGLGQDMKLQQNMLQNMLNGGASQLAADSLLALKHDPSYQLLFANGNHRQQQQLQPAANKTTINDYM